MAAPPGDNEFDSTGWARLFDADAFYPVLDQLFTHLTVRDYLALRRVNSRLLRSLDSYVSRRHWNANTWLSRFFSKPASFRALLLQHKAIIAGPCVLGLLSFQRPSPSSPQALDIYIEVGECVAAFEGKLMPYGYLPDPVDSHFAKPPKYWNWRHHANPETTIRIHRTEKHPLLTVLNTAQTTACVNFVAADTAYCMFPHLTLACQKVMPLRPMDDDVGCALRRIDNLLGWGTENLLWPDQHPHAVSRMSGPRRVGDRDTLVIPLDGRDQRGRSNDDRRGDIESVTQSSSSSSSPSPSISPEPLRTRIKRSTSPENHQFHVSSDRFGGRRPSRTRGQQMTWTDLANYTPQIQCQELASPALSARCLVGSHLWRSFLSDRLRRWALVEMYKIGRDKAPLRLRGDVLNSAMVGIPHGVVVPSSWRYADGSVREWWDDWCREEEAKASLREANAASLRS